MQSGLHLLSKCFGCVYEAFRLIGDAFDHNNAATAAKSGEVICMDCLAVFTISEPMALAKHDCFRRVRSLTFVVVAVLAGAVAFSSAASAMANCAAKPSACGFPDATNTGVQRGVTLKVIPDQVKSGPGWHWDSRGWVVIDRDDTVFSGFAFNGEIWVEADRVTVKNVRLTGGGLFAISVRHAHDTRIQHCTIGPPMSKPRLMVGIKDIYGDAQGTRVSNCDISNTSTAVQLDQGVIAHNYIHDMGMISGDHINGITSNGSATMLTIKHNTIFNQIYQTDAIGLFEDFGVQANRLIDNNLIAGGGYTIYAGQNPGGPKTYNIKVTNNRFSKKFFPKGGSFGPATAHNKYGSGNIWSNNVWDEDNTAINAPPL
jgi:hypothetical protein